MPSGGRDVGYLALPIIPSFEGGVGKIDRDLDKMLGGFTKSASKALSEGIGDGVAQAEAQVKRASGNIAKIRDKEAAAADKLRVAEERINEVRTKGGSSLARAEAQRNAANRSQQQALREIERETKSLTDAQERLARAQERAAKGGGDSVGDALQSLGDSALTGGSDLGGDFVSGFTDKLKGLGGKGGPVAIAVSAAIAAGAAVALGGGALIASQIAAGMEQQQALANVQAKLGVDDVTMKRIADAAGKAYASSFGESVAGNMEIARSAIEAGLISTESTTAGTSQMIGQLDTVSKILGEEIPLVSRAAAQAIKTGLAPDATAAFDLIVKGQQAGLNTSEDLLDTLNEYGTQFRKLGLDGPQALGLISQMLKGGARDSDVAADALKEFSIRAIDGSEATGTALQALGLDFNAIPQQLASGGPAATAAFQTVVDAINQVQDPVQRAAYQVALFGTQSEDLGAALNSIDTRTAVQQLGQVDGAAKRAADTMGNTTAGSFETARRSIEVSLDQIQNAMAGAFGPQLSEAASWVGENSDKIIGSFGDIAEGALKLGGGIGQAFAGALDVVAVFQEVIGRVVGGVSDAFGGLLNGVGAFVRVFDEDMGNSIDAAGNLLHGFADLNYESASDTRKMADAVRTGSAALIDFGDTVGTTAEQAARAQRLTQALGDTVTQLPDGKTITITENTPEAREGLRLLGIDIVETPTGLTLTATTDEAQAILDAFRASQTADPITPEVKPKLNEAAVAAMRQRIDSMLGGAGQFNNAPPSTPPPPGGSALDPSFFLPPPRPRAAGGLFSAMPSDAVIQPATDGLVQWAEPSTKGEAFIPLGGGARSVDIWQETGRRLGVWKFDQGGFRNGLGDAGGLLPFTNQLRALVAQTFPMISDIGGYRSPDGYNEHSSGRALDVMIPNWESAQGMALGDQIAAWALSIPGVNRVMWQKSLINSDGSRTPVPDRGSPTKNHMDHVHIFTDDMPAGEGPVAAAMPGFGGASYGGTGFGGAMGAGTGSYTAATATQVREADQKVADADTKVRLAEQRVAELDADAKQSTKDKANADLESAKREAADARTDAAEVKRGKYKEGSGSDTAGGFGEVGDIAGSFLKETLGLGDLFPDPSQLGIVKLAQAVMGIKYTPQGDGSFAGGLLAGVANPFPQGFDGGGSASGLPFGMIPSAIDAAGMARPGMAPPGSPASGIGFGTPPGPVDNSRSVAVTVNGIDENHVADNVRRQVLNVERLNSYAPKGG